ncbi:MAG: DUF5615 family PIN-like protein [Bacteroidota bacterium]|nr:DUF5615 family PIN-like protein [Bacteroidota bacterium]
MVRVYLDEDVSVLIAVLLRARSIDAIATKDVEMLGKSDEDNLKKAISLKCIFITHNRVDFENMYSKYIQNEIHHYGIIVLSRKRDVYASAQKLVRFFSQHKNIDNQLWYA